MKISLLLFASILCISNVYPLAAHAGSRVCLQKAQQLGQLQNTFMDPIDRGFLHPGVYVSSAAIPDEELGRLSEQLATSLPSTDPNYRETLSNLVGVFGFDGEVHALNKAHQRRFETVVADIERKGNWRHIESVHSSELLESLIQYAKTLNDLRRFGLPSYPGPFRDGGVVIRKAWGNHFIFYQVEAVRKALAQNPNDLQIYNKLVDEVTKLYQSQNSPKAILPSGPQYKKYWMEVIVQTLENASPDSPQATFVGKYYRFINSTPKAIKTQMLDMLERTREILTQQQDPIKAAAYAHQRTIDIHPFADGNGRIARLLVNMVLRSANYPSISMMSDEAYTQAILRSFESKDDAIFKEYLSEILCRKAQKWEIEHEQYGKDIEQLAHSCLKKAQQYYDPTPTKTNRISLLPNPIKECRQGFTTLINEYQYPMLLIDNRYQEIQ